MARFTFRREPMPRCFTFVSDVAIHDKSEIFLPTSFHKPDFVQKIFDLKNVSAIFLDPKEVTLETTFQDGPPQEFINKVLAILEKTTFPSLTSNDKIVA